MSKINKMWILFLIAGFFAIIIGASLKINDNTSGVYLLGVGLILELTGFLGLIFYNLSKIKTFFK